MTGQCCTKSGRSLYEAKNKKRARESPQTFLNPWVGIFRLWKVRRPEPGYSRLPVRVITAASTASGAVSHRRMRGPRPTVLAPALAAISASSAAKPPSAPVTMAIFRFFAVGGCGLGQQLAHRRAAALVAEQHQVVLVKGAAHGPEVGQRQGHVRQHAPAALLGGFQRDAVVALVLLLLFFGGGHAIPAEEGHHMGGPSPRRCWMICSSLSCLG